MLFRILLYAPLIGILANPLAGMAQVDNATLKRSVDRGAAFVREELEKQEGSGGSGEKSLAAYALIKAGDSPNSPHIQKVLRELANRAGSGKYDPGTHGVYAAGVELMLLEAAAEPGQYQKEMEAVVQWLVKQQHSSGGWDYVHGWNGGDTSQIQYALLGFWAAERAGVKVPKEVYDKAAQWFLRAQAKDGGFAYHPLSPTGGRDWVVTHGMSAAGAGGLLIIRMHLFPNEKSTGPKPPKPGNTKFGVLEKVDLDTAENPDGTVQSTPDNFQPTVSSSALLEAANRASNWVANRFVVSNEITSTGHRGAYYLYTLERMAALLDADEIAGRDWYREGAAYLMQTQGSKGEWKSGAGDFPTTSLGLLFMLRTTGKILNRHIPLDPLGTGLLAGGRGLPDDLNEAVVKDGKVENAKDLGPIDQLLAELDKMENVDISSTQSAIVEQVQLGDREELIKQKDRLIKLAAHPNAEARRTAIWALGRTEDMRVAKLLIAALDDNNVDVMVEAKNALCILSRKPLGFGQPETPFEGLPESATQEQRDQAVKAWRGKVKEKWAAWYYKYRPYDERDDLSEALIQKP